MSSQSRRGFLSEAVMGLAAASGLALSKRAAGADRKAPFRPRFAICNETFGDWPFDKAFGLAAECGYHGIEIAPFTIADDVTRISPARRREVRRQAETAGLEVVGLHWLLARTQGLHLTSPDPSVRRKTTAYLGALAEFCADLGGKLLIFGSPKQRNLLPGIDREEGMKHATDVLRATLPALEATGVTLAVEPLAPGATDFLNTAKDVVELVERVADRRCRLILDCNAMATESQPIPELIRRNSEWLVHFHANDPNGQGPGFGQLDFLPIFGALREVGYRGWVSVEVFDRSPGPEALARQSTGAMKAWLDRLAREKPGAT